MLHRDTGGFPCGMFNFFLRSSVCRFAGEVPVFFSVNVQCLRNIFICGGVRFLNTTFRSSCWRQELQTKVDLDTTESFRGWKYIRPFTSAAAQKHTVRAIRRRAIFSEKDFDPPAHPHSFLHVFTPPADNQRHNQKSGVAGCVQTAGETNSNQRGGQAVHTVHRVK